MNNFNKPYFSRSVNDFWKRWHISLSSWFRDYVYIPLGGNRVVKWRWYYNLFITFLVSGLWHGANWTFVIWGALHGFYLVFGIMIEPFGKKIRTRLQADRYPVADHCIQVLTTFFLVCLAWVFFRANTVGDAFYILTHFFIDTRYMWSFDNLFDNLQNSLQAIAMSRNELLLSILLILVLLTVEAMSLGRSNGIRAILARKPIWIRWSAYYILLASIILLGVFEKTEFIYFQF